MKPIIEVTPDLAGGLVLSTTDQWLMQDVAESVVKTIGAIQLQDLRIALRDFDAAKIETSFALDDARYEIARGQVLTDRITLARLLPHEIVGLIAQLQAALVAAPVAI
jgi:hypothetical protein